MKRENILKEIKWHIENTKELKDQMVKVITRDRVALDILNNLILSFKESESKIELLECILDNLDD